MTDLMVTIGLFCVTAAAMLLILILVRLAESEQPRGEVAGAICGAILIAIAIGLISIDTVKGETWFQVREEVAAGYERTFYCGCKFEGDEVDIDDCELPFTPGAKWKNRIRAMELEHVVPLSILAGEHPAWKRGGRKACEADPDCQRIAFDTENLRPSLGQPNAYHSNKRHGEVAGEVSAFGQCDAEFDNDTMEPPESRKAEVAHVWLRMHAKYDFHLSEAELAMFESWLAGGD